MHSLFSLRLFSLTILIAFSSCQGGENGSLQERWRSSSENSSSTGENIAALASKGQDYALFFAVDDYNDSPSFDNLQNPIHDAEAIAKELKEMYQFKTEVYQNPTRENIYAVLKDWRERDFSPNDQLFIFLSGHGDFDEFFATGYFITYGNRSDQDEAYLDLTKLRNVVTQIPCEHILLAIDACYSGTIDQRIAFKSRTFKRPGLDSNAERNRMITNLLRNDSRLVVTSGGKERTPDGADHSPFANAFLSGLRTAYGHGDGLFTYGDLLARLERVQPEPYAGTMIGHEEGSFVFVSTILHPAATIDKQPIPPSANSEAPSHSRQISPTEPDEIRATSDGFVRIEGGTFTMGCKSDRDTDCRSDESPAHEVTISTFYISPYEVTQAKWLDVMGNDPQGLNNAGCDQCPVEGVNWYDVQKFIQRLNAKTGQNYRLPTEAEWEYAARGGTHSRGYLYSGSNVADDVAWSNRNRSGKAYGSQNTTRPVGSKQPNELGLYDMSGNVYEWCSDWYSSDYYKNSPRNDPQGPNSGSHRVPRGGSWFNSPDEARCAGRFFFDPNDRYNDVGFRLARSNR